MIAPVVAASVREELGGMLLFITSALHGKRDSLKKGHSVILTRRVLMNGPSAAQTMISSSRVANMEIR